MPVTLDIVVTCTDRKSRSPLLSVRDISALPGNAPDVRRWIRALRRLPAETPARDLYQGETWTASLSLESAARARRDPSSVRLWVASAGYGLVSADQPLAPYAATFTRSAADFVGGHAAEAMRGEPTQRWWQALTQHPPTAMGPRSITELAQQAPGDVLVVLSETYLRASLPDVAAASTIHQRLIVVSSGCSRFPRLAGAGPAFDARLLTTSADRASGVVRPIQSGTRMSLNVRTAQLLVEYFGSQQLDRRDASAYLRTLVAAQPPLRTFTGQNHDDASVLDFLRAVLQVDRTVSKTAALRRFRDTGNRCEQKRFGRLYDRARAELCASEAI